MFFFHTNQINGLHDNAAIAQFPDHLWQDLTDELVHFILMKMLVLAGLMMLRGMPTGRRRMMTGGTTGQIDKDSSGIFLGMVP